MKKVFSILMIIAVLFCFSACSNSSATISGGQTVSGYVPPDSLISSTMQEQTSSSTVQEQRSTSSTTSSSTEQSQPSSSSSQSEQSSTTLQETQSVTDSTTPATEPEEIEPKSLVVYFSCTGNTKAVAEKISQLTGADLYEIVPAEPYTAEDLYYNNDSCRANREMNDASARPEIGSNAVEISAYDTVYIGYPIWRGTMPRIINTFLDTYDLSGKTVMPFCTSGGSGVSKSVSDIRAQEPAADVRDGLKANGYRLPTEAEWEYACRAGTTTPFYLEKSPSAAEANYYGHYPYEIENNYFSQGNLEVKPGEYRQTTVPVGSFSANPFGLFDMHGNVGEWVWDYYSEYSVEEQTDPVGPSSGTLRVYRGGGWNDFAKNMRSAYRATLEQNKGSFNLGIRLVRNAVAGTESVSVTDLQNKNTSENGKIIIAYFSWGGNTEGVAEEIGRQIGADLFEITMVNPYSTDYNTVLDEAQRDQNIQARPELATHVENMEQYDTVLLGYPNWWASIPMPVASFLEEYDFSGKTIIPFCSHGGGRFGQSLTAKAKLAPDAVTGEALSVHYSDGSGLPDDVSEWLKINGIE